MNRPEKYVTNNKKYVQSVISGIDGEFTVKTIINLAKNDNQSIGQTSIYRILEQLVKEEVIFKTKNSENIVSYIKCCKCSKKSHFLLKCNICKNIEHINCESLNKLSKHLHSKHGFDVDEKNIVISGICKNCNRKSV